MFLLWLNCPDVGIIPLLQFPHPLKACPILLTPLSFSLDPLSYRVLHGSVYSFPLVTYSCPLSAGVLHALLSLKVYSWCIHGVRCTPHPPTPLPSCSSPVLIFNTLFGDGQGGLARCSPWGHKESDMTAWLLCVITFLPRSKCLLISWLQSPSTVILETKKIKSFTASKFPPSICHEVLGPDAMILVFWMLSFITTFSLSSFTLIRGSLIPLRRRQWHPTPVLLPGKSHGQRSLVGCSPWGC